MQDDTKPAPEQAPDPYPLTTEFLRKHTVGIDARMADPDNKGRPSLLVYVIEIASTLEAMLETRRPLFLLHYATDADAQKHAENPQEYPLDQRMEFNGPDGTALFSINEQSPALQDNVVFPVLNQAWGLEPDSPFMLRVHGLIAQTSNMMMAAANAAAITGDDPQAMLEAMATRAATQGITQRLVPPDETGS